jgi:hypothetical protein
MTFTDALLAVFLFMFTGACLGLAIGLMVMTVTDILDRHRAERRGRLGLKV